MRNRANSDNNYSALNPISVACSLRRTPTADSPEKRGAAVGGGDNTNGQGMLDHNREHY